VNLQRERIIACFSSLKNLLCDLGMFVQGDEKAGAWVRYWGNRRIRQLSIYRNGLQHGLEVRRFGPANPPQFSHRRNGEPFGEQLRYFSNGQLMEHVLIEGDTKIPYSEEEARHFDGYLISEEDEELYRKYAVHPFKGAFM
jgi:hypothetical protein